MSKRNGRRAAKAQERKMQKQEEMQEERDRRQRRQRLHQENIQATRQEFQTEKAQYLERLMKTGMSDAGVNLLDNMVDRSFILGNITEAEFHDVKWEMHVMYRKIQANFPPQESEITGDLRAFVLDDRDEARKPLTGRQKTIIAQMIRGVTMLVSRSKEGFQQEMNVKSISVSEVMEPNKEEDDVSLGLFGG